MTKSNDEISSVFFKYALDWNGAMLPSLTKTNIARGL